jgi:hypothetical protein
MRVRATMSVLLLACSSTGGTAGPSVDECRLHPVYWMSIAGCAAASNGNWCTGGRTVDCDYQPSEPVCVNGLCMNEVALECEHPPPASSCWGSPCPEDLAYRCTGTAQIDGCTAFLSASLTENFPGTCP